ncbi:hypothetical protein AVHY2522_11175 [Acidovorax sp. SUPP2522]|uniref:hypothetical protein n=1 Tax=unclassified Acidovorax TaxID=2684926 RepID=UPI002349F42F|nr:MULTISPECIES: hypothetical protein [unclassified Acidovorax]WCM99439.1 hypothetical protein M5C96_08495 [Acidovorax sp. GBBC 1281]GKT16295.1 hypothetical protein AVHY2522_11175 [Acidovorax sp. SUPP2522]
MNNQSEGEPFFITEEVEADMRAAGYVFEPPKHVSTVRLREVLASLSANDLTAWPSEIAEQGGSRRGSDSGANF